ncbi:MAG TPA: hypothetical protein VG228_07920 [Solirubrobacteraceae bacterium]|jgi:hypothetical protein|nr:hypothetical protein [Solirubrobacteraceae bacterium]
MIAASAAFAVGGSLAIAATASAASIPLGPSNDTSTASLNGLLNNSYVGLEGADYTLNALGDTAVPCTPSGTPPACTGFPPETGTGALTAAQAQQIAADFTGQTINGTAPDAHTPTWSTEASGADPNYSTDAPKVAGAGTSWASLNSLITLDQTDPTDFPGGLYTVDGDVSVSSSATVTAIGKPVAYTTTFGVSGAAANGFVIPAGFTLEFPNNFTINAALVGDEIQASQEANPPSANAVGTATVTSPEIAALVPGSKGVDNTAQVFVVATSSLTQPDFEVYLGQSDYILGTITGVTFPLTVTFGEPVVAGVATPLPVSSVSMTFPAATSPLQATSCTDLGTLTGTMTDSLTTLASTYFGDSTDSGALNMTATPTTVTDACTAATPPPVKSTATGVMHGLTSGHPTLTLKIKTATAFRTVTIGLPHGLSFVKASKKILAKEISGKAKSIRIVGGKLVVALRSSVKSATITTKKGLIAETSALIKSIKKKKTKTLKISVHAGSTALTATVKA